MKYNNFLVLCVWLTRWLAVAMAEHLRGLENSRKQRNVAAHSEQCHDIGTYDTGMFVNIDTEKDVGMLCHFPINTDSTFPLLSFAHGAGGGGLFIYMYTSMLQKLASSGFVVCAYTKCYPWCPKQWPQPQLDVITHAKGMASHINRKLSPLPPEAPEDPYELEDLEYLYDLDDLELDIENPGLPISPQGLVGVFGHSSGGISTLLSLSRDVVREYNIGSAVTYDGDGADFARTQYIPKVDIDLADVDPAVPIFMPASTVVDMFGNPPECHDHTIPNSNTLLELDNDRPLVSACIDDMDHLDNVDTLLQAAPLLAIESTAAFFGLTLDATDKCINHYKEVLKQLEDVSSEHYINNMQWGKKQKDVVLLSTSAGGNPGGSATASSATTDISTASDELLEASPASSATTASAPPLPKTQNSGTVTANTTPSLVGSTESAGEYGDYKVNAVEGTNPNSEGTENSVSAMSVDKRMPVRNLFFMTLLVWGNYL